MTMITPKNHFIIGCKTCDYMCILEKLEDQERASITEDPT